ncbi:MAG: hypothetical protein LBU60_02385 [Clostridiales bacterium]|jgi:hypothetical protein|nr:hypothetical protein [Clostridiales bacterium]
MGYNYYRPPYYSSNKKPLLIFCIFAALSLAIGFIAVSIILHYGLNKQVFTLLPPTNISIGSDSIIRWDEVEHAQGYTIAIDNFREFTTTNMFDLNTVVIRQRHVLKIMSIGSQTSDSIYLDSEFSYEYDFDRSFKKQNTKKLDTPFELKIDENKNLVWNGVNNASRYLISSNGKNQMDTTNTKFSLSNLPSGTHKLRVKALSADNAFDNSEWSNSFIFRHHDV